MQEDKQSGHLLDVSMARLTFPAFATAILAVSYGFIDSFFLSKISYTAAAAVGGVFACMAMCAFTLRNFAQAGGIIAGQLLGARQSDKLSASFSVSLMICLALGLLMAALIYAIHLNIGLWLGFSVELNELSSQYLQLGGLIVLLQAISFTYLIFIAIHGYTNWTFLVLLTMNAVNISSNTLLWLWQDGLYLSVTSVAAATCAAQIAALLICCYLVHGKLGIRLTRVMRSEFFALFRQISKIGVPSALFPVSLQMNMLALVVIITRLGPEMLSTQVYTSNILMLIIAWSGAVAQSSQIYISRLVGAAQYDAARKQLRQAMLWAVGGSLFGIVSCFAFSDHLYGLMTNNSVIISSGAMILSMALLLEPLRAINLLLLSSLNACGDAKFPGLLSILMMWAIGLPLSWFFSLPLGYGLAGIYIGRIIDEAARAAMSYSRWRSGIWTTKSAALDAAAQV